MRPWLFRKETPIIGDPDVVNRNSEKMTLGKSVLIVKVFVIDPRSRSLGKEYGSKRLVATEHPLWMESASRFLLHIAILWGF